MRRLFSSGKPATAPDLLQGPSAGAASAPAPEPTEPPPPQSRPAYEASADELAAYLPAAQFDHASIDFSGQFEGLWTDRADVEVLRARRRRSGQLSAEDDALLDSWLERGYVILEGAVPVEVCEQVKADLRAAFEHGDERLRVLDPGDHFGRPLQAGQDMHLRRV